MQVVVTVRLSWISGYEHDNKGKRDEIIKKFD